MKYPWLDGYCLGRTGCVKDYQQEWEATRYMVGGKMFAMTGCDNRGKTIVTLKLRPEFSSLLRHDYADIVPGYYMNKIHWNSVDLDGNVPEALLKQMIDESHQLIFEALPKKVQRELKGEA